MRNLSLFTLSLLVFASSVVSQIKVACIGNSITFGASIERRDSLSYPAQMGRLLGAEWEVKNFGVSGSTLLKKGNKPYWKQQAFTDALAFNPDVVVIKLGTNDTKPYNWKFKSEYVPDYLAMIDTLRSLPSKPEILLCFPAPAYGNRWGIRDSIIRVDVIPNVKIVAKQRKLKTIDLYKTLSNHIEMFPDSIHPNAQGAALIAQRVAKELKSIEKKLVSKQKKQ